MAIDLVICLMPSVFLEQSISKIKKVVLQKFGGQQYLTDSPHITLFLGRFSEDVLPALDLTLRKMHQINACLIEPTILEDKITKKDTIIIGFTKDSSSCLRSMQNLIIDSSYKYKTGILERYTELSMSKGTLKDNLDRYGFPYIGKIWIPHLTICSSEKAIARRVLNLIPKEIIGEYLFNRAAIFTLKADILSPFKEYGLSGGTDADSRKVAF